MMTLEPFPILKSHLGRRYGTDEWGQVSKWPFKRDKSGIHKIRPFWVKTHKGRFLSQKPSSHKVTSINRGRKSARYIYIYIYICIHYMYLIVVIFSTVMWCIVNLNCSISSIRGTSSDLGTSTSKRKSFSRLREADAACDATRRPEANKMKGKTWRNHVNMLENVGKCWKMMENVGNMLGTC